MKYKMLIVLILGSIGLVSCGGGGGGSSSSDDGKKTLTISGTLTSKQ
jgi:ABC-type glycerol-3-phosphate transport system substrate-binding protein